MYLFKPLCQEEEIRTIKNKEENETTVGEEDDEESNDFKKSKSIQKWATKTDVESMSNHRSPDQITDCKLFVLDNLIRYLQKKVELEQTLEEIGILERKLRKKMKMKVEEEQEEEKKYKEEDEQPEEGVLTASRFNLIRQFSQVQQTLRSLESLQTSSEIHLLKIKDQLQDKKAELARRRLLNQSARTKLKKLIQINLKEPRDRLKFQEIPKLVKCQEGLSERRSELMVHLSKIYPIDPISHLNSRSANDNSSNSSLLLFSIADVILPNLELTTAPNSRANQTRLTNSSSNKSSSLIQLFNYGSNENKTREDLADDDSIVSTALGFISHLITLVSSYLNVPLVYPICFFGSRSSVSDFVSRIKGPRSFPLYFKGVDRFRFEYGVFLLNKNIEQIMYHQKVIVSDLRQTLPNLKNLFLTLEPNPVKLGGRTSSQGSSSEDNHKIEQNKDVKNVTDSQTH